MGQSYKKYFLVKQILVLYSDVTRSALVSLKFRPSFTKCQLQKRCQDKTLLKSIRLTASMGVK